VELDKSFLEGRPFAAFSKTSTRRYLFLCNLETNVSRWSEYAVDYFGLPGEYMDHADAVWEACIHPDDRAAYRQELDAVLCGEKETFELEYRVRNKLGNYVICSGKGYCLPAADGEPAMFAGTIVNHGILDNVDALTDIYNIYELNQNLQHLMALRQSAMVMLVGLNRFRTVNDIYGYGFGNEVLKEFSRRLSDLIRGRGMAYRMDGAKFALRIPEQATETVQALYDEVQQMAHDLVVMGQPISMGVSGAALVVDGTVPDLQLLLSELEHAREESKRKRFSELVVIRGDDNTVRGEALARYEVIRNSVHQNCRGFYLCYQPLVEADSGEIIGMEALLRWHGDTYGEVMPGAFIQQLEQDECFFDLGNWVLTQALTDGLPILKTRPDFKVSVNVSYTQLDRSDFRDAVDEILTRTGFPPENLYLELTERRRSSDVVQAREVLEFFRSRGVQIALDDFGTGTASMNLLRNLPINCLKIDRTFISNIRENRTDEVIVETVIESADKLGLRVCLEGIETEELRDYVRKFPANTHQGFYYSRPVPIDQFVELLDKKKTA
jgi:diguanylate cyclase (GGDEF)-like protein